MVEYVRARMALAVVRSNSLLMRGSRRKRSQRPLIDEGAAMLGWQTWRTTDGLQPQGDGGTNGWQNRWRACMRDCEGGTFY